MLEFRVLGPLEAWDGDRAIPLGGRKQRSVLALLLLSANELVSTDALIDGVWGEQAGEKANATLQVYVSNLRRALSPDREARARTIVGRQGGYVVVVDEEQLDLLRFRALAADGRRLLEEGRHASAAAPLTEALSLWRGPALGDLAFEPFATGVVDGLEEARLAATADRVDVELALGRHVDLVLELEELVARHPLRERHWGQLMLALYRSGRQADALRAYASARDALVEELGIDPGPELQDLERRVLEQDPGLLTARPALGAVAPAARAASALPAPATSLVGRDHDVERLAGELQRPDVRLLTLTGPGGVGKTRLAIATAEAAGPGFDGSVEFVALASIEDAAEVHAEIARSVEVADADATDLVAEIGARLGREPSLLVLDNLEQVTGADEPVGALIDRLPTLTVLATSRGPLHLSMEHEVPILPLETSSSVALFVERSRATVPTFELTDENAEVIAAICERVDGLPLAIELAAARTKLLAPPDLLARLERSLQVLVGAQRDRPDRHRTLRATVEWSYALLARPEQALLDRLSVFAGSFTLDDAEALCADPHGSVDVLDGLGHLVDNSLVRTVDESGIVRFRLLQAVREHGREKLAEDGRLRGLQRDHARHVVRRTQEAASRLDGIEGPAKLDELVAGEPDHRAAFAAALSDGDADTAGCLAVALRPYWVAQGRLREGRAWLDEVLGAAGLSDAVRAKALVAAGSLAYYQDDHDRSVELLEEGLTACRSLDDVEGTATALTFLGISVLTGGSPDEARPLAQEALELSRQAGIYETQVMALSLSAMLAALGGDGGTERSLYGERLRLARARQDRTRIADTLNTMAEISLDEGALDTARACASEALQLARGTTRLTTRDSLLTLGRIALADRDVDAAKAAFAEALELCVEFGQPFELAQCLRAIASTASLAGEMERAATLFGAAARTHAALGGSPFPLEQDFADHRDAARQALGEAAFGAAFTAGEVMDVDRSAELARQATG